jgi:tmRNA-binding protein
MNKTIQDLTSRLNLLEDLHEAAIRENDPRAARRLLLDLEELNKTISDIEKQGTLIQ